MQNDREREIICFFCFLFVVVFCFFSFSVPQVGPRALHMLCANTELYPKPSFYFFDLFLK